MVNIDVSSLRCPGHVVVALRGELDISHAELLGRALGAAANSGSRIIVDLTELTFIDCCGVSALAAAREKAREADGDLLLAAVQQPVARLLSLLSPTGLVPVFASVNEAANDAPRTLAAISLAPAQAGGEVSSVNGAPSPRPGAY